MTGTLLLGSCSTAPSTASSIARTLAIRGAPATAFNVRFKEPVCLAQLINLKMTSESGRHRFGNLAAYSSAAVVAF
jgi:hypothetical protein